MTRARIPHPALSFRCSHHSDRAGWTGTGGARWSGMIAEMSAPTPPPASVGYWYSTGFLLPALPFSRR